MIYIYLIDLYDIPRILYTRIIHTHCLQTLTGYYWLYIYIYDIYKYIYDMIWYI